MGSEKFFILIILLVLSAAAFVYIGINFSRHGSAYSLPASLPPTTSSTSTIHTNTTKVQENAPALTSTVVYTASGFTPAVVVVRDNNDHTGCFVAVFNKSVSALTIRLSPYSSEDNLGVLYPPIPPGQSVLIDPRYRVPKIAFHNHTNPAQEFSVAFDQTCSSE